MKRTWIASVGVVALLALSGCSAVSAVTGGGPPTSNDCAKAATEAVSISLAGGFATDLSKGSNDMKTHAKALMEVSGGVLKSDAQAVLSMIPAPLPKGYLYTDDYQKAITKVTDDLLVACPAQMKQIRAGQVPTN